MLTARRPAAASSTRSPRSTVSITCQDAQQVRFSVPRKTQHGTPSRTARPRVLTVPAAHTTSAITSPPAEELGLAPRRLTRRRPEHGRGRPARARAPPCPCESAVDACTAVRASMTTRAGAGRNHGTFGGIGPSSTPSFATLARVCGGHLDMEVQGRGHVLPTTD